MSQVKAEVHEEDPNEKRRKRNRLSFQDFFWVAMAILSGIFDMFAFYLCLRRRFRGVYLFGGHTQFLSTWNFVLRISSLVLFVISTLAFEPHPDRFILRRHERRDFFYRNTAALLGLSVTFSPVVAVCHGVLMRAGDDVIEQESIAADWWISLAMPLLGWVFLVLCRPRHWMYGPARYVARSGKRIGLTVGASRVHKLVMLFCLWTLICRLLGGRWGYRFLSEYERELSAAGLVLNLSGLFCFLHAVAWASWWFAYCISPPIDST